MLRFPGNIQILKAPDGPAGGGSAAPTGGSSSGGGASSPSPSSSPSGASPSGGGTQSKAPSTPAGGDAGKSGTSTPTQSPTPDPEPVGEEFDNLGFGGLDDDDEDLSGTSDAAGDEGGDDAAADANSKDAGQQTQPPGDQQQQTSAQQTPPQPKGPQDQTPSIPGPAEPLRVAQSLEGNFDTLVAHLSQNEFALSQQDIEALETNAPAHIPTIMARLYMKSQINMYKQVAQIIPAMVARIGEVQKRNGTNEAKFFEKWPDLKPDLHGDIVRKYARVYRQANPQTTLDQMIEELGPMVMVAAKVQPSQHANGGGTQQTQQPPMRQRGGARPPTPFKPALGGGAAPPQMNQASPWDGLAGGQDDEE
jgi:hypothetical protein